MGKIKKIVKKVAPIAAPIAGFAVGGPVGAGVGGALGGASGNGLKGALLGGALGYGGGALTSSLGGGSSSLFGSLPSKTLGPGVLGPSSPGTGIAGALGRSFGLNTGSLGGRMLSNGGILTNILSGGLGVGANEDAEKELLKAQERRLSAFAPFANQQFTPGDLTSEPGFQFRLQQGNQALDRAQSARGNYFSGNALKEATDYSQGLAEQEYQNAFRRWLETQQQGARIAGAQSGIFDDIGDVRANSSINNSNLLARGLSGILMGSGFNNTGADFENPDDQEYFTIRG